MLLTLFVAVSFFWAVGVAAWVSQRFKSPLLMPRISIIVAGRNEEQFIGSCLDALLRQDYDAGACEVIFVDDHSTDGTLAIAEELAAHSEGRLTVVSAPPCPAAVGPKKHAISHGVARAKGEILLFTDADCRVRPGWAKAMLSTYDDRTGAVTGPVVPPAGSGLARLMLRLERIFVSYSSASAIGWKHPASASGGNFSYRAAAYREIGGIAHSHVTSGDDDLMAQGIARSGWRVAYARGANAVVEHLRLPTVRQEVNATIRHQSTVRYYPLLWRIAYALSIVSSIGALMSVACSSFDTKLWLYVAVALGIRMLIEGFSVRLFCRQYGMRLSLPQFVAGEICLPVFLVLRSALSLSPSFSWHARTHHVSAVQEPDSL